MTSVRNEINSSTAVGPLIGGLLSNPADQYPSVFGGNEFFKKFPYLLPNMAVASLGLTGLIIGYFTLNETKPSISGRKFVKLSKAEGLSCTLFFALNNFLSRITAQELELATVSTSTTMSEISEDDVRVMHSKRYINNMRSLVLRLATLIV